ncbi:MAG: hypothetical protein Ta2A_18370 [Treponemataceae bacterium]|nr:hypothetical protein FACS1894102_3420 [Spirochaetia bacterium]GMO69918.1 MAG: hypothetical protein Ta2A_18370 [Treponemataceae bacterium]
MPATMVDVHNTRFIREKGMEALTRELGTIGTVYFLRQFNNGSGNWTEDRKKELADVTMETIEKDIIALRASGNTIFSHENIKEIH